MPHLALCLQTQSKSKMLSKAISRSRSKKQKKQTETSLVADRMLSDISPKLAVAKKEPISVIDGKLQGKHDGKNQDSVKLAAAVLRLQPVDSETRWRG